PPLSRRWRRSMRDGYQRQGLALARLAPASDQATGASDATLGFCVGHLERFKSMRRVLRVSGTVVLIVCLFLSVVWANLAIVYQFPGPSGVRVGVCLLLDLIALAALVAVVRRKHWRAMLIYGAAYGLLLAWSGSISASND